MARLISQAGCASSQLTQHWICLTTSPCPAGTPACPAAPSDYISASVPGTVATAYPDRPPADLHSADHWYRLDAELPGGSTLHCAGLTAPAEIWIDGHLAATSDTMFHPLTVPIPAAGASRLELCFRALSPLLRRRSPGRRARWRGRLAEPETLRHHRTTLLGHMPGWSGDTPVIGPFRPITLHTPRPGAPVIDQVDLRTSLAPDGSGLIELRLTGQSLRGRPATVTAAGHTAPLTPDGDDLHARLVIPDPPLWWPHTHGDPALVDVTADIGGHAVDLGRIGFRKVARRDPADGFGLLVNAIPIFCRGAVWTGIDATGQPPPEADLAAALHRARDAGFNMLRVTGLTLYETPAFFDLCDALGIMVWHDFMFARFDYPDDPAFLATAAAEARAFLDLTQAHPSLAVLCGGTEIAQAAAMAGCPTSTWHMPLFEEVLAGQAAALRPDIPYVPHSPMPAPAGLPFAAAAPVTHYFGVGAYLRPVQDLAGAGVRFAAECLAFANPPDPASCHTAPGTPAWRQTIPHDASASWDFEDVRDHYVETLFGVSAVSLRRQDPLTWLALGRAAIALLMQGAIATWRADGRCAGALVLMLQDLVPGAGWGVIAHDGRPKSAWHALRAVCQPIQVLLLDERGNGIVICLINETGISRMIRLRLRGLTPDGATEWLGSTVLSLAPRETRPVPAIALMGRWRDIGHAWRFGPPIYNALGAILEDAESGVRLSDATLFPAGPALPPSQPGLVATLGSRDGTWQLEISTRGFAQLVMVDDDRFAPADNHFHLWPGESRVVRLDPTGARSASPSGSVRALNASTDIHYGLAA